MTGLGVKSCLSRVRSSCGCGLRMYGGFIEALDGQNRVETSFMKMPCQFWSRFQNNCNECPLSASHQNSKNINKKK